MRDLNHVLLREYVQQILKEDDGYGGVGDMMAMGGPMGIAWGGPSLYQTFIQPFTDVLKSGAYAVKRAASDVRQLLQVASVGIVNAMIPYVEIKYVTAFKSAAERTSQIKNEYKEVLDRVDARLMGDDAQVIAFLLNPGQLLAAKALKGSPQAALWAFTTLTGGKWDVTKKSPTRTSKSSATHDNVSPSDWGGVGMNAFGTGEGGGSTATESRRFNLNLLTEVTAEQLLNNDQFKQMFLQDPKKVLSNQQVLDALNNAPGIKKMRQDMMSILQEGIATALKGLDTIIATRSLRELQNILSVSGKNVAIDLSKITDKNQLAGAEAEIVKLAKVSAAQGYAKQFKLDAANYVKAGISNTSDLVRKFLEASAHATNEAERLLKAQPEYNSQHATQTQNAQAQTGTRTTQPSSQKTTGNNKNTQSSVDSGTT